MGVHTRFVAFCAMSPASNLLSIADCINWKSQLKRSMAAIALFWRKTARLCDILAKPSFCGCPSERILTLPV
jgi:hypothetical protein